MAVEVEIPRRLFTVEENHRMAEAGILHPDERVELIEGEIVEMAPIGAGIAEFWLLLAMDRVVEIYREPGSDGYARVTLHGPDQTVSPLAFPDIAFAVADFFV